MLTTWKKFLSDNDCRHPLIEIKIENTKFNASDVLIKCADVNMSTGPEASTCRLELLSVNVNIFKKELTGSKFIPNKNFEKIKIGAKLEVAFGYKAAIPAMSIPTTVFIGFISGFNVAINENGQLFTIINGMDGKMWMMSSLKTELKKEKTTYSQAVKATTDPYASKFVGNTINVIGEPSPEETRIYQCNESDYEFICRIRDITEALFFVSLGKLYFISPSANKAPSILTIEPGASGGGIFNINFSSNAVGIPKEVVVASIDKQDRKKIVETKVSTISVVGDGKSLSQLTSNLDTSNVVTLVNNVITSPGEAKFLGEAEFARRALMLSECEITLYCVPELELSKGIKLKNFGNPIDNTYIIKKLVHKYTQRGISKTIVTLMSDKYNPQAPSM